MDITQSDRIDVEQHLTNTTFDLELSAKVLGFDVFWYKDMQFLEKPEDMRSYLSFLSNIVSISILNITWHFPQWLVLTLSNDIVITIERGDSLNSFILYKQSAHDFQAMKAILLESHEGLIEIEKVF